MRISDWSSDVCSSDLIAEEFGFGELLARHDVETVDDAAIAITHQLARPGMMAGIDRRIDFLHPRGEASCGDEARARRTAASPAAEDGLQPNVARRTG